MALNGPFIKSLSVDHTAITPLFYNGLFVV